ncbi:MAG: hypothetical protein PHP39_10825 [Oscillospiraceae bacterium]|nr:hypothetical protein [Oscillospiraceae bacterium]
MATAKTIPLAGSASEPSVKPLKGKTASGFSYEIPAAALESYELFETLCAIETEPLKLPKLVVQLLGEEQKNKLVNHLKQVKGECLLQDMMADIMSIFKAHGDAKN